MISIAKRLVAGLRRRTRKLARTVQRMRYDAMMLDQQVPLQSVCRTLFDYEVTWFGEREFYDPDLGSMSKLDGLKLLGLQQIPQALPRPYHFSVVNALISDRDVLDPARPNRVMLEIYPDVTRMIEGKNWHFNSRERASKLRRAEQLPVRFSEAFIFSDYHWELYFHFLMDSCLRYVELKQAGAISAATSILYYTAPNRWQQEYLDLLGLPVSPDRILSSLGDVKIHRLIIGSPRRNRFVCSRNSVHLLRDQLFERMGIRGPDGDRKVYISRGLASSRRIVNEPEVMDYLEGRGFEMVTLETMPVADQIRLFSEAGVIVAPHGAGLANMIFSAKPRIIELLPADGWDLGWFLCLTNQLGFDYLPIATAPGTADDTLGKRAKGGDFAVDLPRLRQVV